ncbi:MAG: hypothetical protein R3E66_06800 [bacterium]
MRSIVSIFVLALAGCITPAEQAVSDAGQDAVNGRDAGDGDVGTDTGEFLCEATDNGLREVTYLGDTFEVKCWSAYGGGWLLVARSGRITEPRDFGWTSALESPEGVRPYSLGRDLDFDEILVTAGPTSQQQQQIYDSVLRLGVPPDFFAYDAMATEVTSIVQLKGDCDASSLPSMFSWVGHVSDTQVFWFRDKNEFEPYGLGLGGWQLNSENECGTDGKFGGQHGAIYVRARKEAQ